MTTLWSRIEKHENRISPVSPRPVFEVAIAERPVIRPYEDQPFLAVLGEVFDVLAQVIEDQACLYPLAHAVLT